MKQRHKIKQLQKLNAVIIFSIIMNIHRRTAIIQQELQYQASCVQMYLCICTCPHTRISLVQRQEIISYFAFVYITAAFIQCSWNIEWSHAGFRFK
jgi:hypothetical protein